MYELKKIPEDFKVEEVNNNLKLIGKGSFSLYKLTKKDVDTFKAIRIIAEKLRINQKYVNYAGTKDKKAVTTQYVTISKGPPKNFDFNNIRLEFLGSREERLSLGELSGNNFEITIRNIERKPKEIKGFPNFFDSQRFGIKENNHIIGKCLVLGDFKKAAEIITEENVANPIEYFQKMPKRQARLYVHAYQSYLFNKLLERNPKEKVIPLIGFGTEPDEETQKLLDEEEITTRDFIIRKIPYLSSEGENRDAYIEIKDLFIGGLEDDDENLGKKKCVVKFYLPKGSYATMAIKYMTK
ncbi:tRNA pseudouridine(13) synthase TruD [Candidatus Woesearchaeota archaeon]|nr:tRNA pseudouridine(13) synthase TruD [Candidatus Woesearchaeota archaeon]